eukprot:10039625-Alexandrium_andersonii.AAC.1
MCNTPAFGGVMSYTHVMLLWRPRTKSLSAPVGHSFSPSCKRLSGVHMTESCALSSCSDGARPPAEDHRNAFSQPRGRFG